jgi:hypothetical protein
MRRKKIGSHAAHLEFSAGAPTTKIPTRSLASTLRDDQPRGKQRFEDPRNWTDQASVAAGSSTRSINGTGKVHAVS